ncbi:MAG: hypothetical protein COT17_07885 [Elusimicrobia bacterium CG08_land_8_20_14_0_20_51_18]|nr:MAG: hypothetical protein COT17_07885 [Elusimicrobia bacterium CG08_land_8_20_14_0_20_51_18]
MGKNKIFLVEDDFDLSKLLKEALESLGYEVELCDGGREVPELLRSSKPDLLLMDVMLPGMDGYSLVTQLAAEEEFSRLPIVVMSALPASQYMFDRFPQVVAFFPKPFNTEDLVEAIKTALAKK